MASGAFSFSAFPAPLAILTQLALSSATVGLTPADSLWRPATLPLISACVYSVLTSARAQMRPRWASLLGGASFMFLLQYLDLGVVRRWNWRDRGPVSNTAFLEKDQPENEKKQNIWEQFRWAWSSMFALRHVNTKWEARNTPPFKDSDPSWVPSKPAFLVRESAIGLLCYLMLDLMTQRPPPPNAPALFNEALIPVFRRLGDVTIPQLRLRALSIAGFAATFWALIRGYAAVAGTVTVALGLNEPRDWRPPFSSLSQAYSIQNLWGKVWHQNLRSLLTEPAAKITYDFMGLPHGSLPARFCRVFISFTLSGLMHSSASIAAGMSPKQTNVLQFFLTQAMGVMIEDLIRIAFSRVKDHGSEKTANTGTPSLASRVFGYLWVAVFMTWSGPV